MTEDDDLPVLTHILRTGTPSTIGAAILPVPDFGHHDAMQLDEPMIADQLVIGHESHGPVESYLEPSTFEPPEARTGNDEEAIADIEHDRDHPLDSFRLSQDHAGGRGSSATMNEPEFASRDEAPVAPPIEERVHEDPAVFASRIRDAVLEDLGARIDTELDARIAQAIHAEVESAVAQLQGRLRSHLTEALRDVVQRAVDEEIARLGTYRSGDA